MALAAALGNMAELLTENQKGKSGHEAHLNDRVVTLAAALRESGYHTGMVGKWHLGHGEGAFPFDRGSERSFSMLVGGASPFVVRPNTSNLVVALSATNTTPNRKETSHGQS